MRILFFSISFLLLSNFQVNAQFGKLKERLKIKSKEEMKMATKKKPLFDTGKLMGDSDIELEKSYDYDFSIEWDVESEDGKAQMTQLFSTKQKHMGMIVFSKDKKPQYEKVEAIIDVDRSYFIILNQEDMQAMVMEFENVEDQIASEKEEVKNFTIKKTNETKTIAGYLCTKYLYENEEGEKGEIWVTEELDYESFDMMSYFKKLSQQKDVQTNGIWSQDMKGFILEVLGKDSDGKDFRMTAEQVDTEASINYPMDAYQKVDLTKLDKSLGRFNNN